MFDASTVPRLTTDKVIRRGTQYQNAGAVTITALTATSVRAHVRGTKRYTVVLDASGHPDWSCTCPAAIDGDFCKHCVAVALELAATDAHGHLLEVGDIGQADDQLSASPGGQSEQDRLVEFLNGLTPDRLVAVILEQAAQDWRLREMLLLEADSSGSRQIDLGTWKQRIDDAMFVDDYVDWRQANAWATDVVAVLDALEDLIDHGHAAAVIQLAEYALRTVEQAVGYVDDSDSGCLRDTSERASELHLRACTAHPPDPVALARSLVALELDSELEGMYAAADTYAELLGQPGLAEYGRLLDALGDSGRSDRRYALKAMRRAYLSALNDVDALVAELGRDPGPGDVTTIIELLAKADRIDEAIAAGHAGMSQLHVKRFSTSTVIDALAPLLRQQGDTAGAIRLYHDAFVESPSLLHIKRLLEAVEDDRDRWLDAAIDLLRTRVSTPALRGTTPVGNDVLVEVLIWAGQHEAAWEAARSGGCQERRWMQLAAAREMSHPIDAIDVYEPRVIRMIEAKNNQAYVAAVELMERVMRLADAAGVPERFITLVAIARTVHKPKRNLQKLLDQRGWRAL